jgi:hypothetical protein
MGRAMRSSVGEELSGSGKKQIGLFFRLRLHRLLFDLERSLCLSSLSPFRNTSTKNALGQGLTVDRPCFTTAKMAKDQEARIMALCGRFEEDDRIQADDSEGGPQEQDEKTLALMPSR